MQARVVIAVAIDGPGSSGKGTVARDVARALGFAYVDTGAMYRAVALFSQRAGVHWADGIRVAGVAQALEFRFDWNGAALRVFVGREDVTSAIRTAEMGSGASRVSAHPEVRAALLGLQRALAAAGGVVMDGRDIGTVVLPTAELKVYLDAALDERARRRHTELAVAHPELSIDEVRTALADRDRRDTQRAVAPLRRAPDAVYLDTTGLSATDAANRIVALARERMAGAPVDIGQRLD